MTTKESGPGTRDDSDAGERDPGQDRPMATRIFRRFFDLIERFEAGKRRMETKSAPRPEARITRLDDGASRR